MPWIITFPPPCPHRQKSPMPASLGLDTHIPSGQVRPLTFSMLLSAETTQRAITKVTWNSLPMLSPCRSEYHPLCDDQWEEHQLRRTQSRHGVRGGGVNQRTEMGKERNKTAPNVTTLSNTWTHHPSESNTHTCTDTCSLALTLITSKTDSTVTVTQS